VQNTKKTEKVRQRHNAEMEKIAQKAKTVSIGAS
jgi:hypothetical protein